jgi:hypothetical protein
VNVTRIGNPTELERAYDASGREMMHLQAGVEDYDVFCRGLAIGPQTMLMRYQVEHGFLSAAAGWQVTTFGLTVGAFFGWEFNSFEVLMRGTDTIPIDFANATPDMALISLHYYFPSSADLPGWSEAVRWPGSEGVTESGLADAVH